MADCDISIPKYNDKTIYHFVRISGDKTIDGKDYTTIDPNCDYVEWSDIISASFHGILRLSPNNFDIVGYPYERGTDNDVDALDQEGTAKSKDLIDWGSPIPVSDSVGLLTGVSLSPTDGFDCDTVYVQGVTTINNSLIINAEQNSNAFCINKVNFLPVKGTQILLSGNENTLDDDKTIGDEGLVISKEVNEKGRKFSFQNLRQEVREMIKNSLIKAKTIPPGTIVYVPITLEQYKTFRGSGIKYYAHNMNDADDPIIRDFLLCDGRKYFVRDFPELAKVIAGTKVMYESIVDDEIKFTNKAKSYTNPNMDDDPSKYNGNTEGNKANVQTFRVPDLRHKFIRSVWMDKNDLDSYTSLTGSYFLDHMPEQILDQRTDHSHFIASAITHYKEPYDIAWGEEQRSIDRNNPMILKLSTASVSTADGKRSYQGGWWPGTNAESCFSHHGRRPHDYHWNNRTRDASFFFSQATFDPYNDKERMKYVPSVGKTGYTISNNEIFDDTTFEKEISESQNNAVSPRKENAPEYVACLPLIKI